MVLSNVVELAEEGQVVVLFWYGALEVMDLDHDQEGVVEPVVLFWNGALEVVDESVEVVEPVVSLL